MNRDAVAAIQVLDVRFVPVERVTIGTAMQQADQAHALAVDGVRIDHDIADANVDRLCSCREQVAVSSTATSKLATAATRGAATAFHIDRSPERVAAKPRPLVVSRSPAR